MGTPCLTIQFEEVASRAEVPVTVSSTGKTFSPGRDRRWEIHYALSGGARSMQDGDCLIADFHEQGLLLIDGSRNLPRAISSGRTRCIRTSARAFSTMR